jgi:hypothetical protein
MQNGTGGDIEITSSFIVWPTEGSASALSTRQQSEKIERKTSALKGEKHTFVGR